jgi:ABC-type bacteriocin/lantibiotic exporter with double-glycine peptidase domain
VLHEALGDDRSADALAELLRRYEMRARVVQVGFLELGHLPCPTLLVFDGDTAAVVTKVHRRSVTLRCAASSDDAVTVSFADLATVWHGTAIELSSPPAATANARKTFRAAFGRLRWTLAYVGLVSVVLLLLGLLVPVATALAIDWALPDGAPGLLGAVAVGLLFASMLQAYLGWLRENAVVFLESRVAGDVQRDVLERVLASPFPLLHGKRVGDHLQAMTGAQAVGQAALQLFLIPAIDGLLALAYLGLLLYWLPMAGIITAVLLVATTIITANAARRHATLQRCEIEAQATQSDYLLELITGIATVKTAANPKDALSGWLRRLARERWPGLDRQRTSLHFEVAIDVARYAGLIGVLLLGGQQALDGKLTVGTLLASVQLSQSLWDALAKLGDAWLKLSTTVPHLERIDEALAHPSQSSRPAAHRPQCGGVAVVLDRVWFRHSPKRPWVLSDHSLQVAPGKHLRLRGLSGSGKTTLLRLIAGLYEPEQGIVTVGGMAPAAAQHMVAYLPQDAILYQGSILDNLRLLSGRAPRERLLAAAEATGLHDFVRTLPMGYDTILPPRGSTLSGGQRQLIALTACAASDRPVVLLDEAMSHLDRISQERILATDLFTKRTVVSVVHDRASDDTDIIRSSRIEALGASMERRLLAGGPPASSRLDTEAAGIA